MIALPRVDPVDPVDVVVLDRLTRLAARVLDAPVVCASLVDGHRGDAVSSCGLWPPPASVPSPSAVRRMAAWMPHLGVQLRAADGRVVGTLMVMDARPCRWTEAQAAFLEELADRLVAQVDIGPTWSVM